MEARQAELCRWCSEAVGTLRCGCGTKGCAEMLCADCASKSGPARRVVDGGPRPIITRGEVLGAGYAAGLTREERQHVRLGTAYIVAWGRQGRRWKVAAQRSHGMIYWHDASEELAARLTTAIGEDKS